MSFTTVHTRIQRLNYIAALLAAGVALLAASAVVWLDAGASGSSKASPSAAVPSIISVSQSGLPVQVWYLVSSAEDAAWIRMAEAEQVDGGMATLHAQARNVHVLVAITAEEAAAAFDLANTASGELAAAGLPFSFHDMRSR